jgi:hypothetical protein
LPTILHETDIKSQEMYKPSYPALISKEMCKLPENNTLSVMMISKLITCQVGKEFHNNQHTATHTKHKLQKSVIVERCNIIRIDLNNFVARIL